MRRLHSIGNWLKSHKIAVLVHSLIWLGFTLYALFLAGPLFARFEIIPGEASLVQMELPAETNNLHFNLDKLITAKSILEIQGWAFIDGYSADNNQVFIVLKSPKTSYVFNTAKVWDNPITAQYGGPDLNLDWSGFITTIPLRKIEKGDYTLGLCIKQGDLTALQYSDKTIFKSNTGVRLADLSPQAP